jgi:hypothetical protein
MALEQRAVTGSASTDPLHAIRRDDYLQLSLERFF